MENLVYLVITLILFGMMIQLERRTKPRRTIQPLDENGHRTQNYISVLK